MSNTLFDLSGKIDRSIIEALSVLKREADALHIPFFIVGATSRDIILHHLYGLAISRMTRDIDMGIRVASWDEFLLLAHALTATGLFTPARERQRLLFNGLPIDIVPFGEIMDQHKRISWPPDHAIFMSVVGFEEAFESSTVVRLSSDPELDVRLPTLAGLGLLKIISWAERYPERPKDAEDLMMIMQNYEHAGNLARLYDQENYLLEEEGFDTRLAGIRLLGRDMAKLAAPDTAARVKSILAEETRQESRFRLLIDMIHNLPMRDEKFRYLRLCLEKLRQGFSDIYR